MSKEKTENTKENNDLKENKGKTKSTPTDEPQVETLKEDLDEEETDDIKSVEDNKLDKLQDDLAEAREKFLRLYSEYDNYRRRTAKEKLDMMQTANEDLILSLLPVLDDFERAENSFSENAEIKTVKEGINLISQKFTNILQQKGLKKMETKEGTEFDAELHEAITQIPAPKAKLKGKIIDTVENGYYLGDKVIRHARVVIGN